MPAFHSLYFMAIFYGCSLPRLNYTNVSATVYINNQFYNLSYIGLNCFRGTLSFRKLTKLSVWPGTAFFIITAPGKCAERLLEQSPSKNTGLMALFNFVSKVFLFVILTCFFYFILLCFYITDELPVENDHICQTNVTSHSFIYKFIHSASHLTSQPAVQRQIAWQLPHWQNSYYISLLA